MQPNNPTPSSFDSNGPSLPSNITPPGAPGGVPPKVNYAGAPTMPTPKSADKKRLIVLGLIIVVAVAILLYVLVKSTGNKSTPPATTTTSDQSQGPQPATALGIEQASNAISQDISSLHDDVDFPPNALKDASLGL